MEKIVIFLVGVLIIPYAMNSDAKFYNRQNNSWFNNMKPVLDAILKSKCN